MPRPNLTDLQPGLDLVPDVRSVSLEPRKGEIKAHNH